ncbi:MAG TPA: DUF5996 family protein [Thermodesulfobacteriota bacterium]
MRRQVESIRTAGAGGAWPALPLAAWRDTYETLRRWAQLVGKTRLALAPRENHWWHTALYPTARGLTTSPMPYGNRTLEVDFDFVDHNLIIRTGDGATRALALAPRSVADFYREYVSILDSLGLHVPLWPVPVEIDDATPLDTDRVHASYDADAAHRFWLALAQATRVLREFRGRFLGKSSPVHFFWGSFDLACTRFSGRRAPTHPGGVPNLADRVTREAYSHECTSAGWWPGGGPVQEPAFYAYAYPEPGGFADAPVRPAAASYHAGLREFVLPYDAVRTADRPEEAALDFFQSTYEAAADLAGWDRAALEPPDARASA